MARFQKTAALHHVMAHKIQKQIGKSHFYALNMQEIWADIMPASIAEHTTPIKLTFKGAQKQAMQKGSLTLSCPFGYQTVLVHQREVILQKLQAYYGPDYITNIHIQAESM